MASLKELIAQRKQLQKSKSGGDRATKIKTGSTRYRILPSWRKNDTQFYHDFGQHFIKDENGENQATYICVDTTYNRHCPLCEMIRAGFYGAKDDKQKELVRQMFSSSRILVNALDINTDRNTPIVLDMPASFFLEDIFNIIQQNLDPDNEDFNILTDPDKGVDITITRTGVGKSTSYTVTPVLNGSQPVKKEVLAKMSNLDEFVAQEQELALAKATSAARELIEGSVKALPSSTDNEFEDDIPDHASGDIIEGNFVRDESIAEDDLEALLEELDAA